MNRRYQVRHVKYEVNYQKSCYGTQKILNNLFLICSDYPTKYGVS